VKATPQEILHRALTLLNDAEESGLVITVTQIPVSPLAMGNYATQLEIRDGIDRRKNVESFFSAAIRNIKQRLGA
jgi:hypothetical protein